MEGEGGGLVGGWHLQSWRGGGLVRAWRGYESLMRLKVGVGLQKLGSCDSLRLLLKLLRGGSRGGKTLASRVNGTENHLGRGDGRGRG
jgi:hypothetical protein